MRRLLLSVSPRQPGESFVVRLTERASYPEPLRNKVALLIHEPITEPTSIAAGFRAYLAAGVGTAPFQLTESPLFHLPEEGAYLGEGDVVRFLPTAGLVSVLYRRNAPTNTLLLTERCNCICVMCSQPPRQRDDPALVRDLLTAIPLMDPACCDIGISGGEPTLLGTDLIRIVREISRYLPAASIQMLSNARLLRYFRFARDLADAGGGRLTVGVPLHSDVPSEHDAITGVDGSFDETIRGLLNLQRCGIPVQLRLVLQKQTVQHLSEYARFIRDNLSFAAHIAFMGLEGVGLAKAHLGQVWVDPADYVEPLEAATFILRRRGHNVSLFNVQLCLLPMPLREIAVQSISDWKMEFLPECSRCTLKATCCGFFGTDGCLHSRAIRAVEA